MFWYSKYASKNRERIEEGENWGGRELRRERIEEGENWGGENCWGENWGGENCGLTQISARISFNPKCLAQCGFSPVSRSIFNPFLLSLSLIQACASFIRVIILRSGTQKPRSMRRLYLCTQQSVALSSNVVKAKREFCLPVVQSSCTQVYGR